MQSGLPVPSFILRFNLFQILRGGKKTRPCDKPANRCQFSFIAHACISEPENGGFSLCLLFIAHCSLRELCSRRGLISAHAVCPVWPLALSSVSLRLHPVR